MQYQHQQRLSQHIFLLKKFFKHIQGLWNSNTGHLATNLLHFFVKLAILKSKKFYDKMMKNLAVAIISHVATFIVPPFFSLIEIKKCRDLLSFKRNIEV